MFYKHLKGVLSAAECESLISRGNALGFEQALVNRGDGTQELITRVRNNERVIFDDNALARELESKLMARLASDFPYTFKDVVYRKAGSHFRLYKYTPEQYFKPHRDGSFQDLDCESEITVLFYLNDTDGGDTVLMPHGKGQEWSFLHFPPKAGDVLMFEHPVWHEGRPVNSGEKFVLRTDLFYSPGLTGMAQAV